MFTRGYPLRNGTTLGIGDLLIRVINHFLSFSTTYWGWDQNFLRFRDHRATFGVFKISFKPLRYPNISYINYTQIIKSQCQTYPKVASSANFATKNGITKPIISGNTQVPWHLAPMAPSVKAIPGVFLIEVSPAKIWGTSLIDIWKNMV